ncbi:MAG: Gfo/Idh/MocA family oxidoreductase [Phycisphaerae bacterium]
MSERHASGRCRSEGVSRRQFLKTSAAASAAVLASGLSASYVHAAGSDRLRVGLIGCGGRGNGAARNCAQAAESVEIYALGDLFPEKIARPKEEFKVADERCFSGFDNYQKVIASGVDLIILATPPGFRPIHFKAAVEAGKHVFMEKPVCVDPWGHREICLAADKAAQKGLSVVAGTQRRHQPAYVETMKRIRDGAIGDLLAAQCYWIGGAVHQDGRQTEGMTDIEFQIRNWYNWCWLCGDHIVEQHVHNIDIMNWAFGAVPEKCLGLGGRQVRQEPGNIWDHFAVEFEYAGGVRVASYCAHLDKAAHRVSERVVGTKGTSDCAGRIWGENAWQYQGGDVDPYVQEHADLLAAVRSGAPVNEGRQVADSTMTAVLGRMSAYTGRELSWKWATEASQLKLGPADWSAFGPFEPPPVPMPGQTPLL